MPKITTTVYPFIKTSDNRLVNETALDSFYKKLEVLKKSGEGTVNIVHIGDSHLQAGSLTATVRKGLQSFFGNAGRGMVFPYQLAKSNAPDDIKASSNVSWKFNRLAHPEIDRNSGISGFYISSNSNRPSINFNLKADSDIDMSFSTIKLFLDTTQRWLLQGGNEESYSISSPYQQQSFQQVNLNNPANNFTLESISGNAENKVFYGASLENNNPGVLYHSIGINGAKFDSYLMAPLFFKQLPVLHADLYIISLGTNEAQAARIDAAAFTASVKSFVDSLLITSPGAAVLITTPADSYFNGKVLSKPLKDIHDLLVNTAESQNWALWDLYKFTGAYGSSRSWNSAALMSHDRIHYNKAGYELQGNLLLSALSKGYDDFVNEHESLYKLLQEK